MADKFNFNGQLLERGNRVIADVVPSIEINTIDNPEEAAAGLLQILNQGGDLPQKLKMSLNLPAGQPGAPGKMPKIGVNVQTIGSAGEEVNPTVEIREAPAASEYDYILYFGLPRGRKGDKGATGDRGPQGISGRTPNISIETEVKILNPDADAYIDVVETDGVDKTFELHIPRGPQGEPGEQGKPFTIDYIFKTFAAMLAANTQGTIKAGQLALVTAHTTETSREEDARLYQKTLDGSDSGTEDSRLTDTGIAFLSIFSGAKGTTAKITNVSATTLNSNQSASVTNTTTLNESTDTNETTIALRIPKGASSTVSEVTVNTLNSNQNATASATTTYDSTNDINKTAITLGVPKGASSIIADTVNVTTLNPGSSATASASTVYNSSTDKNITTLSLGIPSGTMPTIEMGNIEVVEDAEDAYVTVRTNPQVANQYLFDMGLPPGLPGPAGPAGPAGQGIAEVETSGGYTAVTSISATTGDSTLYVTKGGIPATDITSGSFEVNRGGTGKTSHTVNSILTGNNVGAIKNVATADGAFYATAANAAAQFGTLPIAQGGTGTTTAAGIRNTLGLGNTTGALPVANGGTGATTAASARSNLGVDTAINTAKQEIRNILDEIIVMDRFEPVSENTKIWIKI